MKTTIVLLVLAGVMVMMKGIEGINGDTIKEILDKHNHYRRIRKATNMKKIKWDYRLQKLARKFAEECDYNPGFDPEQNYSKFPNPAQLMWTGEKKGYFTSAPFYSWYECNGEEGCDARDQILYSETNRIGCDHVICMTRDPGSTFIYKQDDTIYNMNIHKQHFFVCFYGPRYNGGEVYGEGKVCSECDDKDMCNGSLCDDVIFG